MTHRFSHFHSIRDPVLIDFVVFRRLGRVSILRFYFVVVVVVVAVFDDAAEFVWWRRRRSRWVNRQSIFTLMPHTYTYTINAHTFLSDRMAPIINLTIFRKFCAAAVMVMVARGNMQTVTMYTMHFVCVVRKFIFRFCFFLLFYYYFYISFISLCVAVTEWWLHHSDDKLFLLLCLSCCGFAVFSMMIRLTVVVLLLTNKNKNERRTTLRFIIANNNNLCVCEVDFTFACSRTYKTK